MVAGAGADAGATSVWAQYTIITEHRDGSPRPAARRACPPRSIIRLVNRCRPTASSRAAPGLRQTERLARRVISLPMHPYLTDAQQDLVIGTVRDALSSLKRAGRAAE